MVRIAGLIYPNSQAGQTIHTMLRVYQGDPDTHSVKNIQLGQSQKKITSNAKKTIFLVFDGEIWNKAHLKEKLHFDGTTEEIFIAAYEQLKDQFLESIDGDFAFGLYDATAERLILGRDRIGRKPLYWYQDARYFLFSSEIKALLITGIVPQTIAQDGIAAYFALGYFPQDLTSIDRVNKLLPGYYLVVEKDRSIHIRTFWSLSAYFSNETYDTKEQIQEKLSYLIDEAVRKRIPAHGEVGCFVSGGLGSASIAYHVNKFRNGLKIIGLTSGFEGENSADMRAAADFCQALHLPQKMDSVTPNNFLDELVPILWEMDEPVADPNLIPIWHLSKLAKGLDTVFSGMGSDELLAGHNRYTILERFVPPLNHFFGELKKRIKKGALPLIQMIKKEGVFAFIKHTEVNPYLEQYVVQNQLFSFSHFHSLSPQLSQIFDPDLFLQKFHNISKIPHIVSACVYLDMKTRLPDHYILQYDRLMTANGLDWRTPYLDKDLIEYAASIPEPDTESTYLRDLYRGKFPDYLVDRPKKTRRSFLNDWVNRSELKELFPLLKNGTLVNTGLISKKWVEQMCEREETMESSFRFLFSVLILEIWFRIYINKPLTCTPPKQSVRDLLLEI